jgi:hypothetical protein
MDSRMIEVAIGLALVFALTSLLVSAVQEVYSSATGMRGRVLRQAIVSFLGDDERMAAALLDHPLLVSLSPQGQSERDQRRPSYVRGDSIVAALLGHLIQTHAAGIRPESPLALVQALQGVAIGHLGAGLPAAKAGAALAGAEAALPNPLFARGLATLVIGAEHDWPAFEARLVAWFDAVGDRSTGWFKRKTQVGVFIIGLGTAAALNINPLVIGSRLWQDEALRTAVVTAAEKASQSYGGGAATGKPDSREADPAARAAETVAQAVGRLGSALDAAVQPPPEGPDMRAALLALIEQHQLAKTRLTAWQSAGAAGAAAGGPEARAHANALASALAPEWPAALPRTGAFAAVAEAHAALRAAAAPLARPAAADPAASAATGAAGAAPPQRDNAGLCTALHDSEPAVQKLCGELDALKALQAAGLPIGWSGSAAPSLFAGKWAWANALLVPLGWLVTALACTLGAPFWFDALGKLVRLRGSGQRPAGGGAAGTAGHGDPTGATTGGLLAASPPAAAPAAAAASAAGGAVMSDALNDDERRLTVAEVQRVQRALGLLEVDVSGFFDGRTRRAIQAWQQQQQVEASGELSAFQIQTLMSLAPGSAGQGDDAVG